MELKTVNADGTPGTLEVPEGVKIDLKSMGMLGPEDVGAFKTRMIEQGKTEALSAVDEIKTQKTELEKQLEEQKKAATEQQLTDSERIAAIEEREAIAQREREAERREAEKAVKIATWRSEAVARGLPDDTYVDATLSLEDGVKYLEGYQAKVQEKITAGINAKLGSSTLPGSGNIGEATPDRTGWTGAQWADHFAKKSKATVVGNPAVPGVTGAA